MNYKIIAVDFDGTLCENKWPEIGAPNHKLIEYLKEQRAHGDVQLILWTCRVSTRLTDAIKWCYEHGLCFDYINENTEEVIKEFGTESRKIFAHEYIDDRAINRPEFDLPFVRAESEQEMENLDCKTFAKLYDCTISDSYNLTWDSIVYRFRFNKDGLEWVHVVPYLDFKNISDNQVLENNVCRAVISNLMERGLWQY